MEPVAVDQDHQSRASARALLQFWRAFLRARFDMRPDQEKNLRRIPGDDAELVQHALHEARRARGEVEVRIATDRNDTDGELTISRGRPEQSSHSEPRINVIIAHGHFDVNCRNWKCRWGPHLPDEVRT